MLKYTYWMCIFMTRRENEIPPDEEIAICPVPHIINT